MKSVIVQYIGVFLFWILVEFIELDEELDLFSRCTQLIKPHV